MAIKVRRVKRVFGFEEEKTEKYLIIPDRATVVSFEHLCDQIADTVGLHRGVVRAAIYGLVSSMKTFIRQGHAVRIDGFGTFIPTISAKSSAIEEEAEDAVEILIQRIQAIQKDLAAQSIPAEEEAFQEAAEAQLAAVISMKGRRN